MRLSLRIAIIVLIYLPASLSLRGYSPEYILCKNPETVIRSVEIIRLDPFGTSINKPELEVGRRSDRILNSTHYKTRESVIRSYLLFNIGDTVSQIVLEETERALRKLPFIYDALVECIMISEDEAAIRVITRDDYSLGGDFHKRETYNELVLFERNLAGNAHELEFGIPFEHDKIAFSGFRSNYKINNISGSFSNLDLFLMLSHKERRYGFNLSRDFISASSEYAGSATVFETVTTTRTTPDGDYEPLEYSFQDYWLARSFLIDRQSLTRIIIGMRYIHNNVYKRPEIDPYSFLSLQKYKLFLSSISYSRQNFMKTNYLYNYGRTEDVPYGMITHFTTGREISEFRERTWIGTGITAGGTPFNKGYFKASLSTGLFLNEMKGEQGLIDISVSYFTELMEIGDWRIRNFISTSYTQGFNRYSDEYLVLDGESSVTGFKNDSLMGSRRLTLNLETVLFSPVRLYGFGMVIFGFADMGILGTTSNSILPEAPVTAIGTGLRLRNDNLVISTFQIRIGYYPNLPENSRVSAFSVSGEKLLKPGNFDASPPEIIQYR